MLESNALVRSCPTCRAIYRTDFERCPSDGAPLQLGDSDPLIGSVVAKHYKIEALLGEGGMGRVYRAHHTLLQHRQVAIKVLLGDLAATIAKRLRFGQEAELASRLDHPNVVSVIDYGADERLLFLVMELIPGRTLGALIAAEAPIAPRRAIALARQLCHGLAHAHDRGLVHRDFKPDNVIVSSGDEHAVITDFGIAISRDDAAPSRLTTAGIALGTPSYAAPEQTHRGTVDQRADLFALGVTLYEMLAGRLPFDGDAMEVVVRNASEAPPSIELRSGVRIPPALEMVVRLLMARRPDERFASARDVLEALDALEAPSSAIHPASPASPVAIAPRPSRKKQVSLVVALAAIASGGLLLGQGGDQGETVEVAKSAPAALVIPRALPASTPASTPPIHKPPTPVVEARVAKPRPPPVARSSNKRQIVEAPPSATIEEPPAPVAIITPPVDVPPLAVPIELPPPKRPDVPLVIARARTQFDALQVRGSLSKSVIARALDRTTPRLRACFATAATAAKRSPAAVVHVTFSIDETRQAASVKATSSWPELGQCVGGVINTLRTETAPDVGVVPVSVDVTFQPEAE